MESEAVVLLQREPEWQGEDDLFGPRVKLAGGSVWHLRRYNNLACAHSRVVAGLGLQWGEVTCRECKRAWLATGDRYWHE